MTEDSSVLELKADTEFALKNQLTDLKLAHQRRLAEEEKARLAGIEAKRLSREKAQSERRARLRVVLKENPDRWVASINNERVLVGRKDVSFECQCGTELLEVLDRLGDLMELTFQGLANADFSNGDGHPHSWNSEARCPKCGSRCLFRVITVPY